MRPSAITSRGFPVREKQPCDFYDARAPSANSLELRRLKKMVQRPGERGASFEEVKKWERVQARTGHKGAPGVSPVDWAAGQKWAAPAEP